MAAGVTNRLLEVADLVALVVESEKMPAQGFRLPPMPLTLWQQSRAFRFGATVGAVVFANAGAGWLFLGVRSLGSGSAAALVTGCAIVLDLACIWRLISIGRSPSAANVSPKDRAESARQGRRLGIHFGVIVAVETLLIGIAASVLATSGYAGFILPAVVAIVVLHLVP